VLALKRGRYLWKISAVEKQRLEVYYVRLAASTRNPSAPREIRSFAWLAILARTEGLSVSRLYPKHVTTKSQPHNMNGLLSQINKHTGFNLFLVIEINCEVIEMSRQGRKSLAG
jgi:hypothetical protein